MLVATSSRKRFHLIISFMLTRYTLMEPNPRMIQSLSAILTKNKTVITKSHDMIFDQKFTIKLECSPLSSKISGNGLLVKEVCRLCGISLPNSNDIISLPWLAIKFWALGGSGILRYLIDCRIAGIVTRDGLFCVSGALRIRSK